MHIDSKNDPGRPAGPDPTSCGASTEGCGRADKKWLEKNSRQRSARCTAATDLESLYVYNTTHQHQMHELVTRSCAWLKLIFAILKRCGRGGPRPARDSSRERGTLTPPGGTASATRTSAGHPQSQCASKSPGQDTNTSTRPRARCSTASSGSRPWPAAPDDSESAPPDHSRRLSVMRTLTPPESWSGLPVPVG